MTAAPETRGELPFGEAERERVASDVAGVLAEHGVAALEVVDPRFCLTRTLTPRVTNLPAELLGAVSGTMFRGAGVVLMVDEARLHWAASGELAGAIEAVGLAAGPRGDSSG